jgi:hypothetical protein
MLGQAACSLPEEPLRRDSLKQYFCGVTMQDVFNAGTDSGVGKTYN